MRYTIMVMLLVGLGLSAVSAFAYIPSNGSYPYVPSYNYSRYNYSSHYNVPSYNYSSNYYRPNQYPNYSKYRNSYNFTNVTNGTQDGHLFVGQIQLYDRLLFNQVYRKERRWWASRDTTIEYPSNQPIGYTRTEVISAIRIYNQFLDGNSARATVLKGGVGYQYVKILLDSKKMNRGFQYLVQIYGH